MDQVQSYETEFHLGPRSLRAYSRLNYNMWYALAEFIDNSTQSRLNYGSIIDGILEAEGTPLVVEIDHDRFKKEISIKDNSIGMTDADLVEALKIAHPTPDSIGRSKYGIGMKTAAWWIGRKWKVITCEWASGKEWTATMDLDAIANGGKIPIEGRIVDTNLHYTKIVISELNRNIQQRTEEAIRSFIGSMYRYDLEEGRLKILYNGQQIVGPGAEAEDFDTDPDGKPMRMEIPPTVIGGKNISGWVAVMLKGGRKFGGFSLFQNRRQIEGYPAAWKPSSIFGGIDGEGANNLIAQRLTGLIELDHRFEVSHTKDKVLYEGDEQEDLETYLRDLTKDYRSYSAKRRSTTGEPWKREKVDQLFAAMKQEFTNPEMKDALNSTILPPLETILANNQQQAASLTPSEQVEELEVSPDLRLLVSMQEKSPYEPYLTFVAGADRGTTHVIINGLHPYYCALQAEDSIDECLRQYIYDAIAEYKVNRLDGRVNPDSVRRFKDGLLRVPSQRVENAAAAIREGGGGVDGIPVNGE